MAIRTLGIDIMSYLKGDGFNAADKQVGVLKGSLNGLKGIANSSLGQLAVGYFGVNKLITEYGKAVEASNYQIEQETKLYSTMKGQGFRDEQIENVKKYASELQDLGVVGDEVTLAGTQQLATYNLTEQSLKKLMPAMQNIIVQQKGINATGGDAVGAANMLAKGLLGQTGELKQAGITLNERQEKLIKVGTQEQKVAALVEAVTMNVGEQNKAFLNTPEGKIKSSQNAIGDLYERMGMMFRGTRAEVYEFFGNNMDTIERFLKNIIQSVLGTGKAITRVGTQMYKIFNSLPPEVQNTFKILGEFFAITHFPIAAGVLLIEDLFTAFEGGDSLIQQSFDKLMGFVGIDLTFNGAVDDIKELWKSFEEANGVAITLEILKGMIDALTTSIGILGDAGKTVTGALGLVGNTGKNIWKLATNDDYTFDDAKKDMSESWNDGSGKMLRDGFMGNVDRSMEFLDRTMQRSNDVKALYDKGQDNLNLKNLNKVDSPEVIKEVSDIQREKVIERIIEKGQDNLNLKDLNKVSSPEVIKEISDIQREKVIERIIEKGQDNLNLKDLNKVDSPEVIKEISDIQREKVIEKIIDKEQDNSNLKDLNKVSSPEVIKEISDIQREKVIERIIEKGQDNSNLKDLNKVSSPEVIKEISDIQREKVIERIIEKGQDNLNLKDLNKIGTSQIIKETLNTQKEINVEKVIEKRGLDEIKSADLKVKLPNLQEKKKVELKYVGGDIHIQITGNSDSELIRKIKEEIKKDKSEEEMKLRQLIGGEMIND